MAVIVAGVDGSEQATEALRFAIDEARMRKAELRVVHAWAYPYAAFAAGFPPMNAALLGDFEKAGQKTLDDSLAAVADECEGIDVSRHLAEAPAANALLDASKDADLLVVGSRGHGGFAELLLGSVSHQCALHADCPVAIIPHARREQR